MNAELDEITEAQQGGRHADALRGVLALFGRIDRGETDLSTNYFMTMFVWQLLLEDHPPARAALAGVRDGQAQRLLAGELVFGPGGMVFPSSRFFVVEEMDRLLGDTAHTHALFVQLEERFPDYAARQASRALPALVAAQDYARAARYLPDPMAFLAELNALAEGGMALFPAAGRAPRLAAELSNFIQDVRLRAAIVRGLGRADEAEALLAAALAGLATEEMRDHARRELDDPGHIMRAITAHSMAQDDAQNQEQGQAQNQAQDPARDPARDPAPD